MLLTANIFQPLISIFASVIKFFHDDVSLSWGWSIVLLTVCVRLVLAPLAIKQVQSMRRMQHVQPQMKAIQNKYKQDKQRQQEEMMKFYRENEINPFASCLPLVAQLPVFISLFYMLRKNLRGDICPAIQTKFQAAYEKVYVAGGHVSGVTVAAHTGASKATAHAAALGQTIQCGPVKEAGFLFIKDITNQAHGATLVILMLLYVGTQLLSTLAMPMAPTMDKNQRNLMLIMPVAFVLFVFRFPAGLIVYWVTTNTWTMIQQFTIKRLMGPPPPPAAPLPDISGPSPRRSARGGALGAAVIDTPSPVAGSSGGVGKMLRGLGGARPAVEAPKSAAKASGGGAPPPSSRKKRKRSGRRR